MPLTQVGYRLRGTNGGLLPDWLRQSWLYEGREIFDNFELPCGNERTAHFYIAMKGGLSEASQRIEVVYYNDHLGDATIQM